MHETNLVCVHEAWVAHHVATVGQIDGKHRTTAVGDGRGTVIVQLAIVVGADIATREDLFEVLEESRVDRHDILEVTVDRAILNHQDLAIALNDLRFDLADLFIQKNLVGQLAIDDLLADLRHAFGTQRIGGTRPAEGRLFLLVRLQQGLIRPLRSKARVRANGVQLAKDAPAGLRAEDYAFFKELCCLCHIILS